MSTDVAAGWFCLYTQHQQTATSVDITGICSYSDMLLRMDEIIAQNV